MNAELLLLAAGGASAAAAGLVLARPQSLADDSWHGLRFGRTLDHDAVLGMVRSVAADRVRDARR